MRKLQQKLSKVYLRQQAKGGIIDLEEEGRRMLVVTRGEEDNSSGTEFTELSPTDYQLGRHLPNPQKTHPFKDCVGIPCPSAGPASQPTSPKKQQEEGGGGHWKGGWQGHAGRTTASEKNIIITYNLNFQQCFTGQGGGGGKRGGNRGGKSKGGFNKGESNHRLVLMFFFQRLKN